MIASELHITYSQCFKAFINCSGFKNRIMRFQVDILRNFFDIGSRLASFFFVFHQSLLIESVFI